MNYLGLVNSFIVESGLTDTVQSVESGITDDVAQVAHWINVAWKEFQVNRLWDFRWAEGSFTTIDGKTSYSEADLGIGDGAVIIPDSFYSIDRKVPTVPYLKLRDSRRGVSHPDGTAVALTALRGNDAIELYPAPDAGIVVEYDYYKSPQKLVLNTDTPEGLPSSFHMIIVHAALHRYGADIGGNDGQNTYNAHGGLYAALKNNYINTV